MLTGWPSSCSRRLLQHRLRRCGSAGCRGRRRGRTASRSGPPRRCRSRDRHQDARIGARTCLGSSGSAVRKRTRFWATRSSAWCRARGSGCRCRHSHLSLRPPWPPVVVDCRPHRRGAAPRSRARASVGTGRLVGVSQIETPSPCFGIDRSYGLCRRRPWMRVHGDRRRSRRRGADRTSPDEPETYNPWSVVQPGVHHLADQGLHPVLGESGDPGPPARALLSALGIEPRRRATGRSCGTSGPTSPDPRRVFERRSEPAVSA